MTTPGQKIIKGLQEATRGDFAAVTIDGQRWVRSPAFEAMVEALEKLDRFWTVLRPEGPDGSTGFLTEETIEVWRSARTALALARGERS